MLADVLSESPIGGDCSVTTVVISDHGKGDRPDGKLGSKSPCWLGGRGDGGRYPLSDRIDDSLDLQRHLRSDRSPSWDFPSPSVRPSVLFPDLLLGALHFD
jgi:hypothetical protein